MTNHLISYYNNFYSQNPHPFGSKPSEILPSVLKYAAAGQALDCGAGDGRNSLFLSESGFDVDAVDLSSVACAQLQSEADARNLSVRAIVGDISSYEFSKKYDLVVTAFMLQHLKRDGARQFIAEAQKFASDNGIHVIGAQTVNGDFFRVNPETENFFDTGNELKELYSDWEILEYYKTNKEASIKKADGSSLVNECVFMVARKKL
jgi:tellurite methyltransferase